MQPSFCLAQHTPLTPMAPISPLTPLIPPKPPAPLAPKHRVITLAFLFPDEEDGQFLNRLVARVSKHKTCHVELVFEDDMSFSIFAGTHLFFKKRTFSNPCYHLLSISVSNAEYAALYSFCQSACTHNLGFTDTCMFLCYLQPKHCPVLNTAPSVEVGYTFCSKIVAEALQFAGTPEAEGLIPCTTSPSCLYEAFKDSPRKVLSSVGYRREQLRRVGVVVV